MNDFVIYDGEDMPGILFQCKTDGCFMTITCLGHHMQRYIAKIENMTKISKSPNNYNPPPQIPEETESSDRSSGGLQHSP